MEKKLLQVAGLLLFIITTQAQNCLPDPNFWADYNGKLGDNEILLSIYKSADGKLSGNYRYVTDEKKTFAITGSVKDCTYYLDVVDNKNKTLGKFVIRYTSEKVKKTDNYDGVYTDTNNKQSPLKLQLGTMVGGSATQRYFELFGTTGEVDAFAEKIKAAFINNDKKWLAAKCQYPLVIYPAKGKEKIIKSEKDFLDSYNQLFSKAYVDKFKKIKCHTMFSNHMGVLMGKGEVIINHTKTSTFTNYEYGISSFTVFLK